MTAVYVFLMLVAWTAVLFFVIRPLFKRLIARADQHIEGLFWSLIVFLAFLITLISAWITEGAGVHAIFGAFLAGLMIPHEHGLAIKVRRSLYYYDSTEPTNFSSSVSLPVDGKN